MIVGSRPIKLEEATLIGSVADGRWNDEYEDGDEGEDGDEDGADGKGSVKRREL